MAYAYSIIISRGGGKWQQGPRMWGESIRTSSRMRKKAEMGNDDIFDESCKNILNSPPFFKMLTRALNGGGSGH